MERLDEIRPLPVHLSVCLSSTGKGKKKKVQKITLLIKSVAAKSNALIQSFFWQSKTSSVHAQENYVCHAYVFISKLSLELYALDGKV